MNISITNACNRRCKYCFQRDWYLSKKAGIDGDDSVREIDPEDFRALLRWAGEISNFKIMGGEPLLHSKLPELLSIAAEEEKKLTLISNISAKPVQFDRILPYCAGGSQPNVISGSLINTDYPKNQSILFKRNLDLLASTKIGISLGTTLLPHAPVKPIIERMKELASIYCRRRGSVDGLAIRLAPFCPNPTDSTRFKLYDFSNDIVNLINGLADTGIKDYRFDCPVNYCEVSDDFVDACRQLAIGIKTERCSPDSGMPFDVLTDRSVVWCSSATFLRLDDWKAFRNYAEARRALSAQYYLWWRTHGLNPECRSCDKHNPGLCLGFCIAKTAHLNRFPIPVNPALKDINNAV